MKSRLKPSIHKMPLLSHSGQDKSFTGQAHTVVSGRIVSKKLLCLLLNVIKLRKQYVLKREERQESNAI